MGCSANACMRPGCSRGCGWIRPAPTITTRASPPDPRTQRHALARGYDLSDLRARQLVADDFERADLLLGMDWDNLALAEAMAPASHHRKIRRLTEFCLRHDATVVPDPYYGGSEGFEHVLDLVEDACDGLLRHVQHILQHRDRSRGTP